MTPRSIAQHHRQKVTVVIARPADAPPRRGLVMLLGLALALTVVIVYWPVRQYGFISLDDPRYVMSNPIVRQGLTLDGLQWAFTAFSAANWHPLTWLSHMLDVSVFGRDAPGAYHMVNVVLHAINAMLVFGLLQRMTGATWRTSIVAALFALHPLRVESVAWIAERKDVLSVCFGLLAIGAYAGYARSPRWWRYALVALLLACSLLAKPTLVTLPCLLLLLDVWPLRRVDLSLSPRAIMRPLARLTVEKIPLLLLSFGSSVMTVLAQHDFNAVAPLQLVPFSTRLATAATGLVRYLAHTFWPADLALLYPLEHWPAWQWLGACTLILAITALAIQQIRARPYLAVGWFWFVGSLVPMIGLVQVGGQSIADRYTYWPSIGLMIMLVWGIADVLARTKTAAATSHRARRAVLATAAVAIIIALSATTRQQILLWRNSETLYRHALSVTRNNWMMHNAVGTELMEQGEFAAAAREFETAVRIYPNDVQPWRNLGEALVRLGLYTPALQAYRTAVQHLPDHPRVLNDLAVLLVMHPEREMRNPSEAMALSRRACELTKWRYPEMIGTLAGAQLEAGRVEEGLQTAERAQRVAQEQGQTEFARQIAEKIALYRAGQLRR